MLWGAGMVAAIPFVLWWWRDVARIPSAAWYWTGHVRRSWRVGVAFGWVAGGWPAILVAVFWWRGAVRRDLLEELRTVRHEHHHRDQSAP